MRPVDPESKSRTASSRESVQASLGETDTRFTSNKFTSSFRDRRETRKSCGTTATAEFRRVEGTSGVQSSSVQKRTLQPVRISSTPRPSTVRNRRKQRLPARKEIRKLLNRTDFMIPRRCFSRVISEIMKKLSSDVTRITAIALEALQVATEKYIENRFEDAYLLTQHSHRVTLLLRDFELINYLLGKKNL
ncbi:histone H3-like centromeric protein A [Anastrepha ludens]|uniref:histone H3-like centromeric protein A n=1 Tax=Anastrepha ludens TaxID=28586 RepID=UPI0023AEEB40|nr:histone H3-like centromeric protein A [Anastrepha ludens]